MLTNPDGEKLELLLELLRENKGAKKELKNVYDLIVTVPHIEENDQNGD